MSRRPGWFTWRRAALATLIAAGGSVGGVALASSDGQQQFSGRTLTISNRVLEAPNTGPNGDGNSGDLLLRLPGVGDITITGCTFHNNVANANVSFQNTSEIPIEAIGATAFNRQPGFAPGEKGVLLFLPGGDDAISHLIFAGGSGAQRRVASVELASLFEQPADLCSFDIQATAQFAPGGGNG